MIYDRLYSQLSAIETLSVCHRSEPKLNPRGVKLLRYLQTRRHRPEGTAA